MSEAQDFKQYTVPTNLWDQRCSHKHQVTLDKLIKFHPHKQINDLIFKVKLILYNNYIKFSAFNKAIKASIN